jgi:hypothetical protein
MLGLRNRRTVLAAGAVLATLGLSACARSNHGAAIGPAAGTSSPTAPATAAGSPGTSGGAIPSTGGTGPRGAVDNHAAAVSAADRILATFVPPAGAQPLSTPPAGAGAITANLPALTVQKAGYWRVAGPPATVFGALATPAGATSSATSSYSANGQRVDARIFQFGRVPDVLSQQALTVQVSADGAGSLIIAVARVEFYPPRPASAAIPADLPVLTIQYQASSVGVVTDKNEYGPQTVTDASKVARVAAVINALPAQPSIRPCPGLFSQLSLAFRGSPTAAPTTLVTIEPGGCGLVQVRQGPNGAPTLLDGSQGDPVSQILDILGLPWPHPNN